MSILAIVGVIVSSSAMFIVLSGFSGLKNYSLEFISFVSPEIKITPIKGKSFEFTDEMKRFLDIEDVSYGLSYEDKALLSVNENNRIVKVKAVDLNFPRKSIDSIVYQGLWFNKGSDEVVVGLGIAYELGVSTFDAISPIKLYAPKSGKGQVFSEKDILKSVNVLASGVFSLNEELNNSLIFCDFELAKKLFEIKKQHVGSVDVYKSNISYEKISSFFGSEFSVETRIQQNKSIYKMLNTEQVAIYLIFSLIVVVALFNMFGALMMMVIEKQKNLQTLMVLGVTKTQVGKIFFYQGSLISIVGCIIGLSVGVLLVFLQQKFSLFMITPSLAYPVVFDIKNFLFVFFTVCVLGGLASTIVSFYVKKSIQQISQK